MNARNFPSDIMLMSFLSLWHFYYTALLFQKPIRIRLDEQTKLDFQLCYCLRFSSRKSNETTTSTEWEKWIQKTVSELIEKKCGGIDEGNALKCIVFHLFIVASICSVQFVNPFLDFVTYCATTFRCNTKLGKCLKMRPRLKDSYGTVVHICIALNSIRLNKPEAYH